MKKLGLFVVFISLLLSGCSRPQAVKPNEKTVFTHDTIGYANRTDRYVLSDGFRSTIF